MAAKICGDDYCVISDYDNGRYGRWRLASQSQCETYVIDSHCHLTAYGADSLPQHPGVIVIAVTETPAEYQRARRQFAHNPWVRPAVGLHPLQVEHMSDGEWARFEQHIQVTKFVGEIGLDGSQLGRHTLVPQVMAFQRIVKCLRVGQFVTVHSRAAAPQVLEELLINSAPPVTLHWYSGSLGVMDQLLRRGDYFSANSAMISSRTGRRIIERVPPNRLLAETDGPYVRVGGRVVYPADVQAVYQHVAIEWQRTMEEVIARMRANLLSLLTPRRDRGEMTEGGG